MPPPKAETWRCEKCLKQYPYPEAPGLVCEACGGRKESILLEAERLVSGARRGCYGEARQDFLRTCALFKIMTGHDLAAHEGILFMRCVKWSREANKHKRDNLVDDVGYARLYNDLLEGEQ